MTKVKICGITNLDDARHAVKCGADLLGFNFYHGSRRYIEPAEAAKIIGALSPDGVIKVGVFVNAEAAEIGKIAETAGLDIVQLHGDEDEVFIRELRTHIDLRIIKAFRVHDEFSLQQVIDASVTYVLLDRYSADEFGGTGLAFDWAIAEKLSKLLPTAFFLAGGLTPENVTDAVEIVRPYAVDVASGVELSPGKKDPRKVAAFIKAAKEAI